MSPNGIYGVNFYTLGIPQTVIIDDWLPVTSWYSALWVPLLEKAFAKLQGNYEHLVAGHPTWAIRTLTGAPLDNNYHGQAGDLDVNALWNKLFKLNADGEILQAGSKGSNDAMKTSEGIVMGHAYNILDLKQLSNGQRLIKMQNPWSKDVFTGAWSDSSTNWTAALRSEVGLTVADDGVFWMDF